MIDGFAATWPIWFGLVGYTVYHIYDGIRSKVSSTPPTKGES